MKKLTELLTEASVDALDEKELKKITKSINLILSAMMKYTKEKNHFEVESYLNELKHEMRFLEMRVDFARYRWED